MVTVNVDYALAQLERALESATAHADAAVRARASERAARWRSVLEGMASGALAVGSRTPTDAPAWATLEVVHGGFATGALAAGGELLPHERELAARLGAQPQDRSARALHYLSDAGRSELSAMLASGCYRVDVPEEGALLAVVALLARGASEDAACVVDAIAPYLDRLRFYPKPSSRPIAPVATVHVATVGETREKIAAMETPIEVLRMNEALAVWTPLTDRAVELLLETVSDGVPCSVLLPDWRRRAEALIADHKAARGAHRLCKRPHSPKQNLAILIHAAKQLVAANAPLSPREIGRVRVALAGHVAKHGAPKSAECQSRRAEQARIAAIPTRAESARVVASRLAALPADAALDSLSVVARPIDDGAPLFSSVVRKLERCLEASIEELVERGVLTSGEAIANVLPQISAHVRAMGFADPQLARLYAAIDAAFRRRRSLLLLNYESQVRLEELPWVAALEQFRSGDSASSGAARRLFSSVTALAIDSFPHAILPNPMLVELRALAVPAGIELPIVDELAADIFTGSFTAKFVRAADIAARRLEGTLYARYYALPITEIRAIAAAIAAPPPSLAQRAMALLGKTTDPKPTAGPVPEFGALCERMAALEPLAARTVARNGRVIEQQQILTTQNLVPLIDAAGLDAMDFGALARRTFEWLIKRGQVPVRAHIERLRTAKNIAYAWRQVIAYLSLAPAGTTDSFLAYAQTHLAEQRPPFQTKFAPILAGLDSANRGETPAVRLLGWTTGVHPLVTDARSESSR